MIKINLYFYQFTKELLEIESFFSDYRLKKMSNNTSNSNNIQIEYVLKNSLEDFLNKKIIKLAIEVNEFGKPYLINEDVFFNISHSNDLLVIAISNQNLGIDLQRIDDKYFKIRKKLFNNYLDYSNINEVIKAFTIKESYIKYYGKSILSDLKKINYNKQMITGPLGDISYRTFKLNDYYLTLSTVSISKINTFLMKDLNGLIKIEKFNIIDKSDEEEE